MNTTGIFLVIVLATTNLGIEATFETQPFVTLLYAHTYGASEVHKMAVSNCSQVLVRRFIKEKCLINNKWYYKCAKSYRFYRITAESCLETTFSRVCPNDDTFYQACGHNICKPKKSHKSRKRVNNFLFGSKIAVCGDPICELRRMNMSDYHGDPTRVMGQYKVGITKNQNDQALTRCSSKSACINEIEGTKVDQYGCDKSQQRYMCSSPDQSFLVGKDMVCDGKCDCGLCDDEARCNNMTIGLFCRYHQEQMIYIRPRQICDGIRDCAQGTDEKMCRGKKETCSFLLQSRILTPRSKCSIPDPHFVMCEGYRDQMNCTNSTISPLTCNVDGYPTTISEHVICKDMALCDDGFDDVCIEAEFQCTVHKHRLCDGVDDCFNGNDEGIFRCKDLAPPEINCVKRFSYDKSAQQIPHRWVMDGVADCMNNIDENPKAWVKECGTGTLVFYSFAGKSGTDCRLITQLKCPKTDSRMNLERVCSGNINNCDSQVCVAARKEYEIISRVETKLENTTTALFYCLKGLSNLKNLAGKCSYSRLIYQRKVTGITDSLVITSQAYVKAFIDCRHLFGEYFVYVSCAGHCNHPGACPLKPLAASNCRTSPKANLVFSLADDDTLALAINDGKRYNKEYFACKNGVCVSFDKVCNLEDDCKDQSDEENCINNFKCAESGEFIPLSKKCDGIFDCFDYSDECNEECENQVKMFKHFSLLVIALVFGTTATLLNVFTLIHGLLEYPKLKRETALINKSFVLMITFGDLLQGLFLLMLSIGDKFFNKSTCTTQFEWTTSRLCAILGVLSTIGSLVSLYSMTILSIIRATTIRFLAAPAEGLSRKKKLYLSAAVLTVFLVALFVAIFPEITLEDYFVQNLNYNNNPLFVGAPNKRKHLKIFEAYFGRIPERSSTQADMPWRTIRHLVKDMFENNVVTGTNIGFYGGNGFCLFSYFVRGDTSYRWFSMTIVFTNLVCVLIIGGCYVMVNIFARRVSGAADKNRTTEAAKTNRKLQRKITIIIMTDVLTWLPFIMVCIINYTELIDTSNWYFVFCIFFLPINSIINPIGIYDQTIYEFFGLVVKKLKSLWPQYLKFSKPPQQEEIEMNQIQPAGHIRG